MRERPILFSGPMVRAILSGAKTQTRRPVTTRYVDFIGGKGEENDPAKWGFGDENGCWHVLDQSAQPWHGAGVPHESYRITCPYGLPGDRLWVRETWWHYKSNELEQAGFEGGTITRLADGRPCAFHPNPDFHPSAHTIWRKRPSIHLPRWASRITLEITGVRVERLQDISEADAYAEGVATPGAVRLMRIAHGGSTEHADARVWFQNAWNTVYSKPGKRWADNPWVWVLEFRKLET